NIYDVVIIWINGQARNAAMGHDVVRGWRGCIVIKWPNEDRVCALCICDFVNPDAGKTVAGKIRFTGAYEKRVKGRVGRIENDRTNCKGKRVIQERRPCRSTV